MENEQGPRMARDLRQDDDLFDSKYAIVGESAVVKNAISKALKVARADSSVLITGKSGTGKELLARLIHRTNERLTGRSKPMILLNCASFTETLLEAELFGYEKGAFTGAMRRTKGKLDQANGGVLFLDEIGEMSKGMQAKLLRVIQEGTFYRVGGLEPISVDFRLMSATNRDLEEEVKEKRFREDLYYRINVVHIHMPSLKERISDIELLTVHFLGSLEQRRKISANAITKLSRYNWPGNVRELFNALECAVVMGNGETIQPEDLNIENRLIESDASLQVGATLKAAIDTFKKDFITLTLRHTGGNRTKAAKIMDIQRTYLSRLISKFEIK